MRDGNIVKTVRSYQTRIKLIEAFGAISFVLLAPALMLIGILEAVNSESIGLIEIIIAIALLVCSYLLSKIRVKLEKTLKNFIGEYITKDVLAEKLDIEKYEPTGMADRQSIKASGIMPGYDRIEGSDYIKAAYKGQEIIYCDIKMEQERTTRDDDGHESTTYVVVFQGPFVQIPLGKKLNGHVKILERRNKRKKRGILSDLFDSAVDKMGIKRDTVVELENEAFNNQFEIKTNDEELAFYILTPQFMENIIKADEYAAGYTNISFKDETAYIAINNGKDAFEIKKTMYNKKRLEDARAKMRRDMDIILAIIDEVLEKEKLFK